MARLRCTVCGAELPENVTECKFCGTAVGAPAEDLKPEQTQPADETVNEVASEEVKPVEDNCEKVAEEAPAEEQKAEESTPPAPGFVDNLKKTLSGLTAKQKKTGIIALAAALALILVVVVLANVLKPAKYIEIKNAVFGNVSDGTTVLYSEKGNVGIDAKRLSQGSSLDGTKGVVFAKTDDEESSNVLFDYSGKLLVDDIYTARPSLNCEGIAVVREVEDGEYELCLWYKGKLSTITSDFTSGDWFAISPDGKTVAYSLTDEDGDTYGYYYSGGKSKELGKDISPQVISNGAKLIYYIKGDTLYVQKGTNTDDRIKLADIDKVTNIVFNADFTEILCSVNTENGYKTYLSVNGGEKKTLRDSVSSVLLPNNTATSNLGVSAVGVSTFAETFYCSTDAVYYISKDLEAEKVSSYSGGASNAKLSDDGKTLFLKRGDEIYKINGTKPDSEPTVLVSEGVVRLIAITDNGSALFYVNEDDEIMYQKGSKKPQRVTDEFDSYADALFNGTTLYYILDDELYSSKGEKGTLVSGVELESSVQLSVNTHYIYVTDGEATYLSFDGKKFTTID